LFCFLVFFLSFLQDAMSRQSTPDAYVLSEQPGTPSGAASTEQQMVRYGADESKMQMQAINESGHNRKRVPNQIIATDSPADGPIAISFEILLPLQEQIAKAMQDSYQHFPVGTAMRAGLLNISNIFARQHGDLNSMVDKLKEASHSVIQMMPSLIIALEEKEIELAKLFFKRLEKWIGELKAETEKMMESNQKAISNLHQQIIEGYQQALPSAEHLHIAGQPKAMQIADAPYNGVVGHRSPSPSSRNGEHTHHNHTTNQDRSPFHTSPVTERSRGTSSEASVLQLLAEHESAESPRKDILAIALPGVEMFTDTGADGPTLETLTDTEYRTEVIKSAEKRRDSSYVSESTTHSLGTAPSCPSPFRLFLPFPFLPCFPSFLPALLPTLLPFILLAFLPSLFSFLLSFYFCFLRCFYICLPPLSSPFFLPSFLPSILPFSFTASSSFHFFVFRVSFFMLCSLPTVLLPSSVSSLFFLPFFL
jgi:hypothetical protein